MLMMYAHTFVIAEGLSPEQLGILPRSVQLRVHGTAEAVKVIQYVARWVCAKGGSTHTRARA